MKKWDFCTQHPFSVLICWLGLALLGICSLCRLDISFYPEVSVPYATITAEFPGMPADEVEKLVTIPLENSISAVKNIRRISSTSKRGESTIQLEFGWKIDLSVTGSDIRNRIDAVYPFLPESVSRPVLSFKSFADSHVMTLAVFPKQGFSLLQASAVVEKELKSRILALDGVAQVHISGCSEPEIQVDVNYPILMAVPALDLNKVADSVRKSIFRYPLGNIEEGERCYSVRTETNIQSLEDLRQIPLDTEGAMMVGDVATVKLGEKERSSFFCHNRHEGIGLKVIKTGGSSLLKTCSELRKMVRQLSGVYGNLFELTIIEDYSKPLEHAILSLVTTIGIGILCACIVIVFLVQNRYVALIIITALPFSLLPVFLCMHCSGMSLNVITLSALAIGSGMVFDNAVVVTEHLLENKTYSSSAPAVIGSTLTTIIIFVPVILLPGLMGKVFSSLAVTVILYLAISCFVSLTLTPALFALARSRIKYNRKTFAIEKWYKKYLSCMKSKKCFLYFIAILILLPLCIVFLIPFKIVPEVETDSVDMKVDFPYGYPFPTYAAWACETEKEIWESCLCKDVTIYGGYDRDSQQDSNTFIFHIEGGIKQNLKELFDGLSWKYQILEGKNFLSALMGNSGLYTVTSSDRATLEKEVLSIKERARQDGVAVTELHGIKNYPEYKISVSENIYSSDLTPEDIFKAIASGAEGNIVAKLDMDGVPVDIRLRYGREFVDTPEKIAALMFKEDGRTMFTQPFIKLTKENSCFAYDRQNRQNASLLILSPDRGNGYGAVGVSDIMTRNQKREISILFIGALVFIWFVLAVQFESCRLPFLILCAVPLGISGGMLALFAAGKSLNISSVLGLMILSGTGVNSGILILSDVARGIPVSLAALSRLRTVCLTLLSTVFALLPVALFDSNPIQNCASISLMGGLLFGTAAMFAMIPVFITGD